MGRVREVVAGGVALGGGRPLALIAGPCVIESDRHAHELALAIRRGGASPRRAAHLQGLVRQGQPHLAHLVPRAGARCEGLETLVSHQGCDRGADPHRHPRAGAGRRRRPRSPTCCRSRRSCAGRRTSSWPRRRPGAPSISRRDRSSPRSRCGMPSRKAVAGRERPGRSSRSAASASATATSWSTCGRSRSCARSGTPSVYDVTHSVQQPGARATECPGGRPSSSSPLAAAGVAAGVDGVFLEVHDRPGEARSDGPNALPLDRLDALLETTRGDPSSCPRRPAGGERAAGASPPAPPREEHEDGPRRRPAGVDLAVARRVLRIEAQAVLDLVDRVDERLSSAVEHLASCPRPSHRDGNGEVGHHRAQGCRHPVEHGNAGALPAPRGGRARRPRGGPGGRRRRADLAERRDARGAPTRGADPPPRAPASSRSPDRPRAPSAGRRTWRSTAESSGEACPLNLAPTASTTAALAFGDALAMTLLVAKGFRAEDFAHLHPRRPARQAAAVGSSA